MTTDLKSKTVEELLGMQMPDAFAGRHPATSAAFEIADRLRDRENALQAAEDEIFKLRGTALLEIESLQARLEEAQQQLKRYTRRSESGESIGDYFDALDALEEAQQKIAEAKAEALEEAKLKFVDAEYFFPKDLAYLSKRLDEWAAEYRAKATEAGRIDDRPYDFL